MPVEYPQRADDAGRNSPRLRARHADADRRAVHQRAVDDAPSGVERSVADEAKAVPHRYRQRVEHGADPRLRIG